MLLAKVKVDQYAENVKNWATMMRIVAQRSAHTLIEAIIPLITVTLETNTARDAEFVKEQIL